MSRPGSENNDRNAKLALVGSIAVLSFVYGFATDHLGLFPEPLILEAHEQAQAIWQNFKGVPPDSDPVVYEESGVRVNRVDLAAPGPTVIASTWRDLGWQPALRIMDKEGNTVHEWKTDPTEIFSRLENPLASLRDYGPPFARHIYENGDLVAQLADGLVRLDACGNVIWALSEPTFHHVGGRAEDGTFWHPARRVEEVDYRGLEGKSVEHDLIVNVSEGGEILREISVLQILDENDLYQLIFKVNARNLRDGGDLTHLNKVAPLSGAMADEYPMFQAGDLLISLRELHLVLVFDPGSLRVKWATSDSLIRQHDPEFMGDGWIGVFDNRWDGTRRGTALGGSRIIAYKPDADSVKIMYPKSQSDTLYTRTAGSWQMLENGNLLITEARAGRIVEVTSDGQRVWDWVNESGKGMVPEVYGGRRLDLDLEKIESWKCAEGEH